MEIIITLRNGRTYTVEFDEADEELIHRHRWHIGSIKYPNVKTSIYGKKCILSRMILNAPPDCLVDHIDGNTLNNRRSNLRLASHGENRRNATKKCKRTSKYRGVCWITKDRCWFAKVVHNKKVVAKRWFKSELDAAHFYDEQARIHHGTFARPNFPE